jgi:hypothetical protein
MRVYTVHAPPHASGVEEAERMVFVKDGISWPALFVPILWFPWHGLWLPLLGYLLFAALVVALNVVLGGSVAFVVGALGAVLIALEANTIRRWHLERRGWRQVGEAFGRDRKEAEFRFFHEWAQAEEPAGTRIEPGPRPAARGKSLVPSLPRRHEEPGLGLFPEMDR